MKSELIVDVRKSEVSIALLEDSRLVSLQKEQRDISYAVGDIYLAKVRKLMPGLNAAFVQVGYKKDAFLHYLDLGPHFATYSEYIGKLLDDRKRPPMSLSRMKILPDIDKHGTITDRLTQGQELLVQIVKEPISSKGPRLTTEITFTGRYLVLIPFSDKISISQKIKTTGEKLRLRQLVESIKPKNFGVIVRTSAEGKRVAELNHELKTLLQCWEDTVAKAQKATAPALIFEEESRIVGMLRDVFSPSYEKIWVNDPEIFSQIDKYVNLISPDSKGIVSLYDKDEPIFDHFGITRQIKSSFGKTVSFRSGAYIIIEHTEALHVIDVNSGNRSKGAVDQESNALEVNLRAADEIARQLRLRDMGGIIVIDFIDMYNGEHRQQLFEHMREVMANDRARHNILPLSKFGLMQITRQRVRPALDIATNETCPSCFGKGEVQPSLLFTDTLYEKLEYVVNTLKLTDFIMYVHPFVDAYIKRGLLSSIYGRWRRRLGRRFKVLPDESLAYLQYRVIDSNRNELDLQEEKDLNESSMTKTRDKARNRAAQAEEAEIIEENATGDKPATEGAPKKKKRKKKPAAPKAEAIESTPEQAAPAEPPVVLVATIKDQPTDEQPQQPKPKKRRKPKPAAPAELSDEQTSEKPQPKDETPVTASKNEEPKPEKKKSAPRKVEKPEPMAEVKEGNSDNSSDEQPAEDKSEVKPKPKKRRRSTAKTAPGIPTTPIQNTEESNS